MTPEGTWNLLPGGKLEKEQTWMEKEIEIAGPKIT
jgi:hypothetical protein